MSNESVTGSNIWQRHRQRHAPTGFEFAFADRIDFLDGVHWDTSAKNGSLFISREYLRLLENAGMENTAHRYALIYGDGDPVACVATQLFQWRAESLLDEGEAGTFRRALGDAKRRALQGFNQRLLICGNLVSSGLHGVAFADGVIAAEIWPGIAEALYRIRRAEKLSGETDFVLIKDFKGEQVDEAEALRTYSYRPARMDPDMVLTLPGECENFEQYLSLLNTKYRSKLKRIRRQVEDAGFAVEQLVDVASVDEQLHALYSEVEQRAAVRTAALPVGYFGAFARAFREDVRFSVIRDADRVVGFISTVREGDGSALAYYVGLEYAVNERVPLYLRLLQRVVEDALSMGCRKISFGRTAAEPKATLGAKPLETWVWARHRLPAVNWFVRQLFPWLPYEEPPERSPFKDV